MNPALADVAIYSWESRHELLDQKRGLILPPGAVEYLNKVMVHTQSFSDPLKPTELSILSKAAERIYTCPKLVEVRASHVIIIGYLPRVSGTSDGITEHFIVIMPTGTL